MKIVAYTDGSCLTNPGFAGWGVYMRRRHPSTGKMQCRKFAGAHPCATNNQMELQGAIEAVKRTPSTCSLIVVTDSQYVQKGATEWSVGWIRRGWKKADGTPVPNKEQWQELMGLIKNRDVSFKWVRGHDGNRGNEYADQLCGNAAAALRDEDKTAIAYLCPHGVKESRQTIETNLQKAKDRNYRYGTVVVPPKRTIANIPKRKKPYPRHGEFDEEYERGRDEFYGDL